MSQTMDAAHGGAERPPEQPPEPFSPPTTPSPAPVAEGAAPPARAPRERSALGGITVSVMLVVAGVMILLDRAETWRISPVVFLAVLLAVVGVGLLIGAVAGRARWLVAVGAVLAVATVVAGAVPGFGARGSGDVTWAPASTAAIPVGGYSWPAGNATVDLTGTDVSPGALVQASLGAGDLIVLVPPDLAVSVRAHVGIGSIVLPDGQRSDGIGRTLNTSYPAVTTPARGTVTLQLDLGVGTLEVRRAQA